MHRYDRPGQRPRCLRSSATLADAAGPSANAGSVATDPALNAAAVAGRRIGPMLAARLAVEEHCKQHFAAAAPVTKGNVKAKSKLSHSVRQRRKCRWYSTAVVHRLGHARALWRLPDTRSAQHHRQPRRRFTVQRRNLRRPLAKNFGVHFRRGQNIACHFQTGALIANPSCCHRLARTARSVSSNLKRISVDSDPKIHD
jgi:hypothetical protein